VKFRPVWSGDFFPTHADHLRVSRRVLGVVLVGSDSYI
jgi:hypothetical protein